VSTEPKSDRPDDLENSNWENDDRASGEQLNRFERPIYSVGNPYGINPNEPLQDLSPKTLFKHIGLFLLTVVTVSERGIAFVGRFETADSTWSLILDGLLFATLLLLFLGTHEFGHYFASVRHGIRTSLPYFIPLPFLFIGTFGAVIRIKEPVTDSRKLFDIGIAGPIAGFVVSVIVLMIGFYTMPGPEYIRHFPGHEAIQQYVAANGEYPVDPMSDSEMPEVMVLGNTMLFGFIASFFENVPPMWEMYHYPFLFAGWLGMFFTALNLMPVGQLDGGHILYCLIGSKRHKIFARLFYVGLTLLGGIGAVPVLNALVSEYDNAYATLSFSIWALLLFAMHGKAFKYDLKWVIPAWIISLSGTILAITFIVGMNPAAGFLIWFVWSLFLLFLVGIEHPPVLIEKELTPGRKILGWIAMIVFVLCISLSPVYVLF
jgi:hypothetical protein